MRADKIRVLVVDDSAVIRGMICKGLSGYPEITVAATAINGKHAIETLKREQFDVAVLDIEMPEMDGITALPEIVKHGNGIRIIMASTLTQRGAEISFKALRAGADDYVPKPSTTGAGINIEAFNKELAGKVIAFGQSVQRRRAAKITPATTSGYTSITAEVGKPAVLATQPFTFKGVPPKALAIGSSTGGPQALLGIFEALKGNRFSIPIFITQHMPPTFTRIMAENIGKSSAMPCFEATNGMKVENGSIYVAPGDHHMLVKNEGGGTVIRITQDPPENFCRPAVDPMLRSLVQIYGGKFMVLILTGMGQDGMHGATDAAKAGATIVAQDEATSVVWGMPGAVAKAGICNFILPVEQIPGCIIKAFGSKL